ncbi:MAG TPA: Holliday junction resolvase RuvX [Mycobacteriales bacterium]|nr:Holliday junction resolvase RuvX [Mycobacteriales bacterium]
MERRGVRMGVDVGSVRVGVALSDRDSILATPLVTLPRDAKGNADLDELARLVAEHEAVEVVVGLPRHLSGASGTAAEIATAYADDLRERIAPVPVRLVDERLSTVAAERTLAGRGIRSKDRRSVVDQAAAVVILQAALDTLPTEPTP